MLTDNRTTRAEWSDAAARAFGPQAARGSFAPGGPSSGTAPASAAFLDDRLARRRGLPRLSGSVSLSLACEDGAGRGGVGRSQSPRG